MQVGRKLLDLISAIFAAAENQRADAALRDALRYAPLSADEKKRVTELVFSYYRWLGWLDRSQPLRAQLEVVNDLAEAFALNPGSVPDADLLERAVPRWTRDLAPISPALLRSFQSKPRLWIRSRPGTARELAKELGDAAIHPHVPDALEYRGQQDLFRTKSFHAGAFELQDLSSQAVSHICGPLPGQSWWDACAGEGGKTLHLCDLMQNKGSVLASDPAEWRLARLKRRAGRARLFNYRLKTWIQKDRLPTKTQFDGVLIDAPCSGVGTWGRNPHARWTTTEADVSELAELQRDLVDRIAAGVKPGGKLVYAVCTLTRAETFEVASYFESRHPEFEPLPLSNPALPGPQSVGLMLLPQEMQANGMYVAAWRRRA